MSKRRKPYRDRDYTSPPGDIDPDATASSTAQAVIAALASLKEEVPNAVEEPPAAPAVPSLILRLAKVYGFVVPDDPTKPIESRALTERADRDAHTYIDPKHMLESIFTGGGLPDPKDVEIEGLKLKIPTGLTLVLGGTSSGKTVFTQALAAHADAHYHHFGEPLSHGLMTLLGMGRATYHQTELSLATAMGEHLLAQDKPDLFIIDSFRSLFYKPSGSTGAGGVDMTLFSELTWLDNVCTTTGSSLVVVVNPMSENANVLENIRNACESSTSAYLELKAGRSATYVSRQSDGRVSRDIRIPDLVRPRRAAAKPIERIETAKSAVHSDLTFLKY